MELTNVSQKMMNPPKNFRPRVYRNLKRKYPRMPGAARKIWVDEVERYVLARMPELIDRNALLYHREFSHAEIKGLIRFYGSDLGRKTVKSMGKIAKKGRKLGFDWGRRITIKARTEAIKKRREKGFDPSKYKK